MKIKLDSKKENKLFDRIDVTATASDYSSTPSRIEVAKELAKEVGCDIGAVVINEIDQPFGSTRVKINARVYPSTEAAQKVEPAYKFARGKPKEATPAAA